MSTKILYISGSDASVDRDISVADAYDYIDPITGSGTLYRNTADGYNYDYGSGVAPSQYLTGSTFDQTQLIYKRTNDIIFEGIYSQYDTFNFNLSGIADSSNNIIRIDWQPLSGGEVQSVGYGLDTKFSTEYVYDLASGLAIGENPKDDSYEHVYSLTYESLTTFQPVFSAFRQDGLVDIYNCSLTVSKDSIYNVASELKLLDSQVLPISSLDPLLKVELKDPNYVDNLVIRRVITPTPTRTGTPPSITQSPTRSRTPSQTPTRSRTPTFTRTKTWTITPTQTKTPYITTPTLSRSSEPVGPRRVTPTPSKTSLICQSQEVTISYTGINDKIETSSVTISLVYNHDGAGNTKSIMTKNVYSTGIFGTFDVKFNVPIRWVSNYMSATVSFVGDDPGISINSVLVTEVCDQSTPPDEQVLEKPLPPVPPPTPTPLPSPTYRPPAETPESDSTNYYTFVFYPGAENRDCGSGFDLPCERNFNVNWRILRTADNIPFSEGEFDLTLVGCVWELRPLGAPLYVKIPYNDEIADSRGWHAGEEVLGGNYTFEYSYKATAISNDPAALDEDGNAAGPCLFGDIDYTTSVVFAGPGQDPDQYTLIPEEKWIDQNKNFTLVFSQS